jgi:hypothetical protein
MEKVGNLFARVLTVKKSGGAGRGIFSGFDPLDPVGYVFCSSYFNHRPLSLSVWEGSI